MLLLINVYIFSDRNVYEPIKKVYNLWITNDGLNKFFGED